MMSHYYYYLVLVVLFISTFVNCDWVEIPQATVPFEQGSENLDFTAYMATTTSTTMQTPILPKPTTNKKIHTSNHVNAVSISNNNGTISHVSSKSSITMPSTKTVKNASNDNVSNNTNSRKETDTYAEDNNEEYDEYDSDSEESVVQEKEEGGYTYANFIPYMSSIQSVLMKSAHKSKKSKVNVLTNLRDQLLGELDHRMNSLWNPLNENREAREYKEDSHVDFPSNEGALMTIGFLTFGVFLIKLVLQLIQAINNKVNNNDNGVTTTTIIGRKRRAAIDDEAIKILNYIEQYRFK